MTRTRVGLIGLSTNSIMTNWGGHAHLPYLQSEQGQKHFEIVALCNSSVASAKKSVEHYKLSPTCKTYASAADLAADTDVDFVVNMTGTDQHYKMLMPVVQAGKDVYTELPLAADMEHMQELVRVAKEKNVRTVFGMQGQTSLIMQYLKEVVDSGRIGKVLSSTWSGAAGLLGEKPLPVGMRPLTQRDSGGNLATVWFLHSINFISVVLGDLATFHSIFGNQRPTVQLMDPTQAGKIVETVQKDTMDQVLVQGRFQSGALFSYHLRSGETFSGEPAMVWSIYGEKGELRITSPVALVDIANQGVKVKLHVFGEKETQELELPKDYMSELEDPSENVGRIYEAYAKGKDGGYPNWAAGLKIQEMIEEMWTRADGEEPFGVGVRHR